MANPNLDPSSIGILLGNGDGTFQPVRLITNVGGVGEWNALAVADVNGDTRPDIIFASCCDNQNFRIGVMLGNGDGNFKSPVYYNSGGHTSISIAIADVNRDGKLDVVATTYNDSNNGTVNVLLGRGDGTFTTPAITSGTLVDAQCIAVADTNGDGIPDILYCSEFAVVVLLGKGDGSFYSEPTHIFTTGCNNYATFADSNHDGFPDIVVADAGASGCGPQGLTGILLGNGDGTFRQEMVYQAGLTIDQVLGQVAVADVDGDGNLDVIEASGLTSQYITGSVAVLLGNGDGSLQLPLLFDTGGRGPGPVAAADLNGDGLPDIVVGNFYAGNVGVLLSSSASQATTNTRLRSSTNTSVYGEAVTFTAQVTSAGGTPSGTVAFYSGPTQIGTSTLVSGIASLKTFALFAGLNSITAKYQGSVTFAPSTSSPLTQTVHQATTSTSVSSSQNPAGTAQSVTLTATITSQYGGMATGSVNFLSGSQMLGTASISGNKAFLTKSFLNAATYSITAHYNGDPNNLASTSGIFSQKILASTSTVVATPLNPSFVGQALTFTATVTSSAGMPPNGEIVTFFNGTAVLGTASLSAGAAMLTTSSLPAGVFTITARYPGDSTFAASTSAGLRQTVNSTTKAATATTLASSLNPSVYGQKITFTARVTTSGPLPPTGTVVFLWTYFTTTYSIGTANVNTAGVATLTKSNLNAGSYAISAVYRGDANNLSSTSAVLNLTVLQTTSAAALTSSLNPSTVGQAISFTAKITSPTVIPSGPVTFKAGTTELGTAQLSGGKATFMTSTLAAGSTVVKAIYNGNSNIKGSSASLTQTVQP